MARYKNARKVNYLVQRDRNNGNYFVIMLDISTSKMIKKTKSGWYAEGMYHDTHLIQHTGSGASLNTNG